MSSEKTAEQDDENVIAVETTDDSEDEVEEVTTEVESSESLDDKVYLYRIPVEVTGNTIKAVYKPSGGGKGYLSHYSINQHVVITDKTSPQFHKDEVNVTVEELTRGEVEASDNLVRDFV